MKLTTNEFKLLRDFVNEKTGIFIRDEKMYFLENRLDLRLKEINCDSVQDYYRVLKFDDKYNELDCFTELLTTNETYFFRDMKQLEMFALEALPEVVERRKAEGKDTINIWSAGCSTGEEPYTLAMMFSETVKDMKVKITATDINKKVVDIARKGVYFGRSLKDVPQVMLTKYFTKYDDGAYEVVPEIKQLVDYIILNLVDKTRMRLLFDMDFIFCRNVLIYFQKDVARQVISSFYDSLRKNGYILLGLAESMHLYSGAFKLVKFKELFGYKKE